MDSQTDRWTSYVELYDSRFLVDKTFNQTKTLIHGSPDVLGFIFQNGQPNQDFDTWGVQMYWVSFSKTDTQESIFGSPV